MKHRTRFVGIFLLSFSAVFLQPSSGRPQNQSLIAAGAGNHDQVVYVCACLKTKSCSCMTEAKMEGPCACGTEGGPPLKAVPRDSSWAKENRDELAK